MKDDTTSPQYKESMGNTTFRGDGSKVTDAELVDSFLKGDEKAFSLIVLRYQNRLMHTAVSLMDSEDDAMDMVQEAFVKAYFNLEGFRSESSLYTWLYRILYNLCISSMRRKKIISFISMNAGEEDIDFPSHDSNPEQEYGRTAIMEDVRNALKKLPAKQRMVFVMKQQDGLKHEEIAQIMGITEGAVKASYFHAVRKLRELLKQYRGEYEL